jgi:hypothetical protein
LQDIKKKKQNQLDRNIFLLNMEKKRGF